MTLTPEPAGAGRDTAPRHFTVKDLRDRLDAYPADAPIWVLDVHPDGIYGGTFHVVNAYMDRITKRATVIVEPL